MDQLNKTVGKTPLRIGHVSWNPRDEKEPVIRELRAALPGSERAGTKALRWE